jgi:hypothetical protein
VIRHQTVGPDLHAGTGRAICQQIEIERIIAILEEGLIAPVAALRGVMGNAGNDEAREAGHAGALNMPSEQRQLRGDCACVTVIPRRVARALSRDADLILNRRQRRY